MDTHKTATKVLELIIATDFYIFGIQEGLVSLYNICRFISNY